jgi:tight adherence protein B
MKRAAFLLAGALVLAFASAAPAGVSLRDVNARGYPTVHATVVTSTPSTEAPMLTENGRRVPVVSAENLGRAKSVVLAVDRSQSMDGGALENATYAARRFVATKPQADRIAVVAVASKALQLTRFASSVIDADIALRTMAVDKVYGTALYDSVVLSARQLAQEPHLGRVIVLVTDGQETTSRASLDDAVLAARKAGALVYVVGIESADFRPAPLRQLAAGTGGAYFGVDSSEAIGSVYGAIANELARTWRFEYVTAARPGERLELAATVGRESGTAALQVPGTLERPSDGTSLVPEWMAASRGGGLVLAFVVGGMVFLAAALLFARPQGGWLRERIEPHVSARARQRRAKQKGRVPAFAGLLRATEKAFGHLQLWKRLESTLARADLPLRTAEFVYVMVGSAFGVGLLAALVGAPTLLVLMAFAPGAVAPVAFVNFKAKRRTSAFEEQLPDLLIALAASLKAGHSFRQGLQTMADEGRPPASKEFKRVLTETTLGRPMDAALNEMAERVRSKDFDFVITAVTIQRQVGGSLASLFDMVADTVRQRQQFARKVKGLTAMGRMSAYVLLGLPFFIAGALTLMNREYMDPLYSTSTGHKLIIGGLVMMGFGSLILKKLVQFKG